MSLIECPECKKKISETTPACPHCGYRLSVSGAGEAPPNPGMRYQPIKRRFPINKTVVMWVLAGAGALCALAYFPSISSILFVLFTIIAAPIPKIQDFMQSKGIKFWMRSVLLVILFFAGALASPESNNIEQKAPSSASSSTHNAVDKNEENISVEPEINYDMDVSGYTKMCADVLYEFGNYMTGEKVLTVITIEEAGKGILKARTDNNDGLFFSINFEFSNKDLTRGFKKGDIITIAGEITSDKTYPWGTVTLGNCAVVGVGEVGAEIRAGLEEQMKLGQSFKGAHDQAIEDEQELEKSEYIAQCVSVPYSSIERNPDDYEGQKIKVSGKVVQVSEGIFDSVTMRIDSNGDMWYVTYTREEGESRILEGDSITCYGECGGVKSYTTVLGSQVTIPSLKMKYHS